MTSVTAENASIEFPLYELSHRSIRHKIIATATGGKLGMDKSNRVSITALDGVSFRLNDGDRVAVIGHNGAGKSVLLRMIAGIYPPTQGRIERQGSVNSLFDIFLGFDDECTGRENIFRRCCFLGLSSKEIEEKMDGIIEFADIGVFTEFPLRTYSAGMRFRLAFAISTSIERDILLMDEWVSAGDESFVKKAEARMMEMTQQSQILVIASHSESIVRDLCKKAILLHHGRLVAFGEVDKVYDAYHGINIRGASGAEPVSAGP